ncbi:hypothetical protein F6455_04695 [Proteobacteria bacterium 005FR1]|nr:hypothetical protein [Proteobacteria bacterium 005FR1]
MKLAKLPLTSSIRGILTCCVLAILLVGCNSVDSRLPEARKLVERHLEAAYGEDGLNDKPAMTYTGRLVIESFDVNAPVVMKTESPDKRLFKTEIMGQEVVRSCVGGQCWVRELDKPLASLRGETLTFMREIADFHRLENLDRYYRHLQTTGLKDFNGEQAYEVTLVRDNGMRDKWYFDKDSGLWLGGVWYLPQEMGGTQVTQYFEEYREFDGTQVATQIIEETSTQTSKVVIDEVKFGDVPDREFAIAD